MAAKTAVLALSKYDFQVVQATLSILDDASIFEGVIYQDGTALHVKYNDAECYHEVTKIEASDD